MATQENEVIVRIIYNEDDTIFAEYQPGLANFSYWLYKKVDADRWHQTGNGIWLGCQINPDEAEYMRRLTLSQWSDNRKLEIIGANPEQFDQIKPAVDSASTIQQPDCGQMSLF